MSSGRWVATTLILCLLAGSFLVAPPASAHPYHLQVSNEVLVNPDPVDLNNWIAQAFISSGSFFVSRLSLYVQDDVPAGDALFVSVRADASGAPSAGNLTQGSAVANGTASWVNFEMNPYVPLVGGTTYWIVAASLGPNNGGSSDWNSGADLLGRGFGSTDGGSTWVAALTNYNYRVYGYVQPSWSFSASQSTTTLAAGQSVVFQASFTNGGPGDAETLRVNFTLPPELTYQSDDASSIGGSRSGTNFTFAGIVSGTFSFNLTATAVGGIVDGTVASTMIHFDGTDHNGLLLASASRSLAVTFRGPRVSVSVAASTSIVDPADDITFNATVTNVGSTPAASVLLEGTVDLNATFNFTISGFASYSPALRTVGGTIANLGVGARASLVWNVTVPPGTRDLAGVQSLARATARDATAASLPTVTSSTLVTVRAPGFNPVLVLDRSFAERGDEVAARLYFNNTGSGTARAASANWTIGSDYALVTINPGSPSATGPGWFTIGWTNLATGSYSVVARLQVVRGMADGTVLPIPVRWAATDGRGNALSPATLSRSVTLRAPAPSITLAPTSLRAETDSTFAITVSLRNSGGGAAVGWLNMTLPTGLTYVDDNVSFPVTVTGNLVSWSVPLLTSGSSVPMGVRFHAAGPAGSVTLRFTFVYSDGKGSPAASIVSNAASVETLPASAVVPVVAGIGIALAAIAAVTAFLLVRRRRGQGAQLIIDDVFVVNEAGVLLAHRSASFIQYQDEDVLVGMFKVVQDFVKDSFSKGMDEDMEGLSFGGRRILIEKGRHHFVAVVYRGAEVAALRERVTRVSQEIDEKFGDTLANWDGVLESVRAITLLLPQVWGQAS